VLQDGFRHFMCVQVAATSAEGDEDGVEEYETVDEQEEDDMPEEAEDP
jgi:hypothetical protein